MITIIPAKELQRLVALHAFARHERFLVCVTDRHGRAVIMGLEAYFRSRERQGKVKKEYKRMKENYMLQ